MNIYKDSLSENFVVINSEQFGTRAYKNSINGRPKLEAECPAEIVQEVYKVWGDTPTVTEPEYPSVPQNNEPTIEDRLTATESAIIALMEGAM